MEEKDYRISFFKPTNAFSRTNRNLVIVLVLIWATGVFGFHILLRLVEKPTPEPALGVFEKAWPNIEKDTAAPEDYANFISSSLSVFGKSSLNWEPERRKVLQNGISWAMYKLLPEETRADAITAVKEFNNVKESISSFQDKNYVAAKQSVISQTAKLIGEKEYSLKAKLLPFALNADMMKEFTKENRGKYAGLMNLYLIHNRSFLTDTNFLGFPFHYFYSAIFLLVMFVVLCWVYAFKIDRLHKKAGNFDKPATDS